MHHHMTKRARPILSSPPLRGPFHAPVQKSAAPPVTPERSTTCAQAFQPCSSQGCCPKPSPGLGPFKPSCTCLMPTCIQMQCAWMALRGAQGGFGVSLALRYPLRHPPSQRLLLPTSTERERRNKMDCSPARWWCVALRNLALLPRRTLPGSRDTGECTTKQLCDERIGTPLFSSKYWAEEQGLGFYNYVNATANPAFWSWNHVQVECRCNAAAQLHPPLTPLTRPTAPQTARRTCTLGQCLPLHLSGGDTASQGAMSLQQCWMTWPADTTSTQAQKSSCQGTPREGWVCG